MGIPYEAFVAVAVVATVALFAGARATARGRPAGLAARIALIALIGSVAIAALVHAPIVPWEQPLVYGSFGQTGGPNLLVSTQAAVPEDYYAYVPGGQIRNVITLANSGDFSLTVLGLAGPAIPGLQSVELRPAPQGLDVTAVGEFAPFEPTEIPAHGEAQFALVITIGRCAGIAPIPTLSSASQVPLLGPDQPAAYGALASISELHVRYSAVGLIRTATIGLRRIQVVAAPPNVTGCPS